MRIITLFILIGLTASTFAGEDAEFEKLCEKLQKNPGAATAQEAERLLLLSHQLGRPYLAYVALKTYLGQNLNPSPALLLKAAENATLIGDYRAATARYKSYLQTATPGEEAAKTAATLYALSIDYLGATQDIYQFMRLHGDKFRTHAPSRKFDTWYLDEARRRKDYAAFAQRMQQILSDKMPLEEERLNYWDELSWLMQESARAFSPQADVAASLSQLPPLVRNNPRLAAEYKIIAAYYSYKAAAGGQDVAAGKSFDPVVAAAHEYQAAYNDAQAVQTIATIFWGGAGAFSEAEWKRNDTAKRDWFVAAFAKLPEAARRAIFEWRPNDRVVQNWLASPEQWITLALQNPQLIQQSDAAQDIEFATRLKSLDDYQKYSAVLKDVPSRSAAIVNSVAAGKDINAIIDHLIQKESWHLEFQEVGDIFRRDIWPIYVSLNSKEQTGGDAWDKAMVYFGKQALANTPLPLFEHKDIGDYLLSGWKLVANDPAARPGYVKLLGELNWVQWPDRDKTRIFEGVNKEFKNWANRTARAQKEKKGAADADAAQISPIDEALKNLADNKVSDVEKAPNPLSKALAQCFISLKQKNKTNFETHAREAYALVKDYRAARTPFSRATLAFLLKGRNEFDVSDLQVELFKDQLKQAAASDRELQFLSRQIASRQGWNDDWTRIPQTDRLVALKLNAVIKDAFLAVLEKGKFSSQLFNRMRFTRKSDKWIDQDACVDVVEKLIKEKTLQTATWRPEPRIIKNSALALQWLVKNEFTKLATKYPPESYFDDMYVEEARKTNFIDSAYWIIGKDEKRKIASVAAQIIAGYESLPLGHDGGAVAYSSSDFWYVQEKALLAEPAARSDMLTKIEGAFGKTRFDQYAMGRAYFTSADLTQRKAYFDKLNDFVQKAGQSRARLVPPPIGALAKAGQLSKEETDILLALFRNCAAPRWYNGLSVEPLPALLHSALLAQKREPELLALTTHFWKIAHDTRDGNVSKALSRFAKELLDAKKLDLAGAYAACGIEVMGAELNDELRSNLSTIRSQATLNVAGWVAVERNDPRYPIFAAQTAYTSGNLQSAWTQIENHSVKVPSMFKELDPDFVLWIIDKHTEVANFEQAESIARQMMQWVDTAGLTNDPEVVAHLNLSYADISFSRRDLPKARAQYERIISNKDFENTRARRDAELKVAEVERLSKQYDAAITRLEKLSRRNDRYLQIESAYQLALVYFDQENYPESAKILEQVFELSPGHANGRILQGRLNLKMKKLIEATEVKVGFSDSQHVIVPGKPLRIDLEDRNLSLVSKTTNIDIRVWTDGGDEELLTLYPFGESKTKFHGQLPTVLAPVAKNDRTVQVLGSDKLYYDFTPAFKESHKVTSGPPMSLTVVTDAEMFVSSGRILTREEIEERALEKLVREKLNMAQTKKEAVALSTVRHDDQVKPGNSVNIRVIDPDRSATAQKDKIKVKVSASSGDVVRDFELQETDTHSGVFEGSISTASAEATAFASDSEEGRQPNFVISAGNYPPWIGRPDSIKPKFFSVDLKDNVALGKMTVVANEAGRKIKQLSLQTSLNNQDFRTVATWPHALKVWDGALTLDITKLDRKLPAKPDELHAFFDLCLAGANVQSIKPKSLAVSWEKDVAPVTQKLGGNTNDQYVVHLYGAFAVSQRQLLNFQLSTPAIAAQKGKKKIAANANLQMYIDGQPPKEKMLFNKGVYRVDVYAVVNRDQTPSFEIHSDIKSSPNMTLCPYEIFDPSVQPEIAEFAKVNPASITANADGTFAIAFGAESRGRVIRLAIEDFDTDAPAINSITLTNAEGKPVLPTKQDLLSLKNNNILEIVPGERISISYEDPNVVTKGKEIHEAFLSATYANADVNACFVEFSESDTKGERNAKYIPMRRFRPGDRVNLFIKDPDGDISGEKDKVAFTVRTTKGQPISLEALETAPHSGIFVGAVFPVKDAAKRPEDLVVRDGDEVVLSYFDRDNIDHGIPWERTVSVEQTVFKEPELRVYDVKSEEITRPAEAEKAVKSRQPAAKGASPVKSKDDNTVNEVVTATRDMIITRPADPAQKSAAVLMEGPLYVEVLFPTIALSPQSKAVLYAQTSTGRAKHGNAAGPFDINVPGTIKLEAVPSGIRNEAPPPGYRTIDVRGASSTLMPIDEGRFTFKVPFNQAPLPEKSLVPNPKAIGAAEEQVLAVRGEDTVFIGFEYKDANNASNWMVREVKLGGDAFFEITDRKYDQHVEQVYVGETMYFRVIHRSRDVSDQKDEVEIELKTASGKQQSVKLMETFEHTGIFKGLLRLVHEKDAEARDGVGVLPVIYGDTVTATYKSPGTNFTLVSTAIVQKGYDGDVLPFTKQFKDPNVAVQTQLMIAESYFELGKKHRSMGQEAVARREIAQGKKLLEEALSDNPNADSRAQGEFLLANLAYEFATLADNDELKQKNYQEALSRFSDLIVSYPDSVYAPKAQFKKALVFEKMGQMDVACEEYVKLSYRYPDNELVADTIARLGQYFMVKSKQFADDAKAQENPIEKEKLAMRAKQTYTTAAQVLGRLAPRFPSHPLAAKTLVLSGQCYINAGEFDKAVDSFRKVVADPNAEKELTAEALYWSGHASMEKQDFIGAYRSFKRVTWDFPESRWAKFARGRLTEPALANVGE